MTNEIIITFFMSRTIPIQGTYKVICTKWPEWLARLILNDENTSQKSQISFWQPTYYGCFHQ